MMLNYIHEIYLIKSDNKLMLYLNSRKKTIALIRRIYSNYLSIGFK